MYGPDILARYLSALGPADKNGVRWQYHSRSDRHSKVGCWGVAFDLLRTSSLMQSHAASGKVILGVNHEMRDYGTGRKKDLDLVIARPNGTIPASGPSLKSLVAKYAIGLTSLEQTSLEALPDIAVAPVGATLVALEAKATGSSQMRV